MEITPVIIEKLSDLAKLDYSNSVDQEKIKKDLERMLSFFAKIDQIDVEGFEPLVHIVEQSNVFRQDEHSQNMDIEDALRNAPLKDTDYFKVPKIMEE